MTATISVSNQLQEFFKGVSFVEEGHKYTIKTTQGDYTPKQSVSKVLENFVEKFNAEGVSLAMCYGDKEEAASLRKSWETISNTACNEGSDFHYFAEKCVLAIFSNAAKPTPKNPREHAFVRFINSLPSHLVPIVTELKMYHLKYLFPGTCDLILLNTLDNTLVLIDYKTNKSLTKNYKGKRLKRSFTSLLDCPMNKYVLQLNIYQILLEQTGFKVSDRRIVWFPTMEENTFSMYKIDDCTNIMKQELEALSEEGLIERPSQWTF